MTRTFSQDLKWVVTFWRLLPVFAVFLTPDSLLATDYRVEARLDTETRIIHGKEVITWGNSSNIPVSELWFHLYFNAWRNENSSFLTSNRVQTDDFSDWREGDWGFNEIDRIRVSNVEGAGESAWDLSNDIEFVQPDDGNHQDRTVARVKLPELLAPGQKIQIEIDFRTKVPRPFARTGARGDYYFLAHWLPKIGVLEKDGTWNCHQFIQTEFYSDFGTYEVDLILPEGWVVGATGKLVDSQNLGNGLTRRRFYQEQVHEFAWTACPRFLEFTRKFEHPNLPPVEIRLLLMPDHLGQEERYFAATEATLRLYGEWFGPYPYGHVTVVDPAWGSRSGGMEYPTLFTGGTRWLNPLRSGSPESVTVHECGHQFWYGIVGNNEFEHAWLDEGFNTYSTRRVKEAEFEPIYLVRRYFNDFVPILFKDLPVALRSFSGLGGYYSELKLDRMSREAWMYGPASYRSDSRSRSPIYGSGAYGVNSYTKPAIMLLTLERYLGWKVFQKAMSTYFRRFQFRSPKPEDFFTVLQEVSAQNLSWFWKQTYDDSVVFDYSVDFVTRSRDQEKVVVRRWGEGRFPVDVEVEFSNGNIELEHWDGQERWVSFNYQTTAEVTRVVVDPGEILALDVNRTNNSWIRQAPTRFAARKWALKWMIWLQNTLESFAFFV